MEINVVRENGKEIAIVTRDNLLIPDVQSAQDFMATVRYETGHDRACVILSMKAIEEGISSSHPTWKVLFKN